jgi:hypothetical protein
MIAAEEMNTQDPDAIRDSYQNVSEPEHRIKTAKKASQ